MPTYNTYPPPVALAGVGRVTICHNGTLFQQASIGVSIESLLEKRTLSLVTRRIGGVACDLLTFGT